MTPAQIRAELRRKAEKSADPLHAISYDAWIEASDFADVNEEIAELDDDALRIFLLLTAEALE